MAKVIHSMIRVLDLGRSLKVLRRGCWACRVAPTRFSGLHLGLLLAQCGDRNCEIELTLNKGQVEAYTHAAAYGHVGVVVNVASTREALVAKGYEPAPVKEFKRGDELLRANFFSFVQTRRYKIECGAARPLP